MMWTHPVVGRLRALSPPVVPEKVWKHLYFPIEGWALLGAPVERMLGEVVAAGAPRPADRLLPARLAPAAEALLRQHHEADWAPIYGAELCSKDTDVGRSAADGRWLFASAHGVFGVAVGTVEGAGLLISVYRPHPEGLNVPWTNDQFRRRAHQRWLRETRMLSSSPLADLTSLAPPTDAGSTWELALAIARVRAVGGSEAPEVAAAASRLAASAFKESATPDAETVLDALQEAIRVESNDPVVVLLAVEEALLVTAELKGAEAAAQLADRAGNLVEWSPAEWCRVAAFAQEQRGRRSPASQWWERVADALVDAAVRSQPAAVRRQARLADLLVPNPGARHAQRLQRVPETRVKRVVPRQGAHVPPRWSASAQHLAGEAGWAVVPPAELRTKTVQAWVVDDQHPDGVAITRELRAGGDTAVWVLDPGDVAELLWLEGVRPTAHLGEALDAAAMEPQAQVGVAILTRPR